MEKILCFLNGYVEVLICGGQTERFFNLCMARGIVVRNLRQNKDKSFTCIFSVNHFFLLGPIRKKKSFFSGNFFVRNASSYAFRTYLEYPY